MNGFISMIGNALLQLVGGDPYTFVWALLSIWFLLWMYRYLQNKFSDDKSKLTDRLEKTLGVHGELETAILLHMKRGSGESEENLYSCIGKSYPYISSAVLEKFGAYFDDGSELHLQEAIVLMRNDVKEMVSRSSKLNPNLGNVRAADKVGYAFALWDTISKPFVAAFGVYTVIVLFVGTFYLLGTQPTWQQKVVVMMYFFDILFLVMNFALTWVTLSDGVFVKSGYWRACLPMYIAPVLSLLTSNWYVLFAPIPTFVVVVVIDILISRRRKREEKRRIRRSYLSSSI